MNSDIWENTPQPKKIIPPDYSFIIECDYWTVSEAVHYLFEALPGTIEDYHNCYPDFSFAMELAERAVISRSLTVIDEIINEEQPFELKVTPIVFLVWAVSKSLNIPDPLKELLEKPDRNVESLSPKIKPDKYQTRVDLIKHLIDIWFDDPMKIPEGNKIKIEKTLLRTNGKLFSDSTFKKAWQIGLNRKLYQMEDSKKI